MKKLLAVLLALMVVGGAFAQVTTAVAASGTITFFNQDSNAIFERDGSGYDTLTFKATDADGKFGFSVTDGDWISDGALQIRDWNTWYKGAYTKVILGNLRNADFRTTLPNGIFSNYVFGTDRITGEGILIESTTLGALTLGLVLPVNSTAMATVDMLKKADIGVKYVIEGMGTFAALANLDLVTETNKFNVGFKYTGMENLVASAWYKGVFATAGNEHYFAFGADYTMDSLNVAVEFDAQSKAAFDFEIGGRVKYAVNEKLTAGVKGLYNSDATTSLYGGSAGNGFMVKAFAEYDYGNGLISGLGLGYGDNSDVVYDLTLAYSVSF